MRKFGILCICILSAFVLLSSCSKDDAGDDDNNPTTNANVEWTKQLALPINPALGQNYMPAIDENDNIYVLMSDFNGGSAIQAFDKNGTELWSKSQNDVNPHNQMPTYFQNKLFFTTDKKLICLNASNGSKVWEYNIPDSMLYITPAIAIVNNFTLITLEKETAESSYLFAINPSNGNVAGTLAISDDRVWLNMAARGNTVYLAHGFLYKVTVSSNGAMSLDWNVQLPGDDPTVYFNFENDMVIAPNGNVTFAYGELSNPSLHILISYNSQGQKLWEYERQYASRITLDEQGNIYDGGNKDLIKINGANGQKIWAAEPPSEFEYVSMGNFTSMVHANNGNLYCGDVYGIYGANYSGDITYSVYSSTLELGDSTPFSDVTLLSNGNIIVMTMGNGTNGNIHCIKANTGGISTKGWSKRGADAANTFNASL
ncbi:MAG: PQQ-like beta-propeller repeat protein [Bacteroidales bacterium]|nr:PQQ-like beta-propeller repeat protein [Bacteroidales bacterium]